MPAFDAAVDELPVDLRLPVRAAMLNGDSVRGAAARAGVDATRLRRAVNRVVNRLRDEFGGPGEVQGDKK
jgi:DNA-directed RNA polymerase specialized sigma24 family protein